MTSSNLTMLTIFTTKMFRRKPKEHRRPWFCWREECGVEGCPYLVRWFIDLRLFSIRLHHFIGSDDERAHHDHSWGFVTIILKGWYDDVTDEGSERMKPGMIKYRPPHHKHTVQVGPEGVWTIILTGRRVQDFGFWAHTKGGKYRKFKSNKWFAMKGHHKPTHPCN